MDNNSSELLYIKEKNTLCCCINDKWCFKHSGIAGFKYHDETKNNCCVCLDCCTWCLEFRYKKSAICLKEINCYMCCCVIYLE